MSSCKNEVHTRAHNSAHSCTMSSGGPRKLRNFIPHNTARQVSISRTEDSSRSLQYAVWTGHTALIFQGYIIQFVAADTCWNITILSRLIYFLKICQYFSHDLWFNIEKIPTFPEFTWCMWEKSGQPMFTAEMHKNNNTPSPFPPLKNKSLE
jgi:hypothetical protein